MLNDATADHSAKQITFKWQMLKFTANVEVATFPSACRPQQIEGCVDTDRYCLCRQGFEKTTVPTARIKEKIEFVLVEIISQTVDFGLVVVYTKNGVHSFDICIIQKRLIFGIPVAGEEMLHFRFNITGEK